MDNTKDKDLHHFAEQNFEDFLTALRKGDSEKWEWLVAHFRERAIPWIVKKDGNLPKDAIISQKYFVEEIFSESLIKFFELFKTGNFNGLPDLRGLLFRIADLKLKEGYRAFRKDQIIFFPEFFQKTAEDKEAKDFSAQIEEQQLLVKTLEAELANLPNEEKEILLRYSKGEKLKNISVSLGLKEENGRKKKQRALKTLRAKLIQKIRNLGI